MIIGLTGIFGAGKSTVAKMMKAQKAKIIDADAITRDLLNPKEKIYKKVAKSFPDAILANGRLDRRLLAAQVFQSPRQLKQLTDILYPEALKRVKQLIHTYKNTQNKIIVIEAPLLFEANWDRLTDINIVVWAKRSTIINRLTKKKFTSKDFRQRMKHQYTATQKKNKADILINNSGNQQNTYQQVQMIMRNLERRTH